MKTLPRLRMAVSLSGLWLGSALLVYSQISPVNVGSLTLNPPWALAVSGKYLYAAGGGPPSGLKIFDISLPSQPFDVGYQDPQANAGAITLCGRNAYVIYSDGLRILDLSNPTNPLPVGFIPGSWFAAVTVAGPLVYLTAGFDTPSWVSLYDVSNPAMPANQSQIALAYSGRVAASGNYAYLAMGNSFVWDVSNPKNPVGVGPARYGNDVAMSGDFVYLLEYTNGFQVFNVSTPTNPVVVYYSGALPPYISRILVSGNFAYLVSDDTLVYDVTNPTNSVYAGTISLGFYPTTAAVSGNFIYAACYPGIRIYALGLPSPTLSIQLKPQNKLDLTWPTPNGGFVVQETPDLFDGWSTLTNAPVVAGSRNSVTLPEPAGTRFYRLIAQ